MKETEKAKAGYLYDANNDEEIIKNVLYVRICVTNTIIADHQSLISKRK